MIMRILLFIILITGCNCMINTMIGASLNTLWDMYLFRERGMISLKSKNSIDKGDILDIVIWKGYGYEVQDYKYFARTLQDYGNIRNLNMNIHIPSNNIIPRCCKKNNTVIFGHSDGGYKCLKEDNDKLIAKITYGATHNSKKQLYNGLFKILKGETPSLSMIGENDGYISYGCLLDEISNSSNKHEVLCVRGTNHLCIVKNKELLLSKIFGLKDNHDMDYFSMTNRIASISVDYINYIKNKNMYFKNYIKRSDIFLKKTTFCNETNFINFLTCKPSNQCVAYLHESRRHVYIKSFNKYIKSNLFKTYKCRTTLEWIMRNEKDIVTFFKFRSYLYIKVPIEIFYHKNIYDISFWFDKFMRNIE